MTPEREKYLAKCSNTEFYIRSEIDWYEVKLKQAKEKINSNNIVNREVLKRSIRAYKMCITVFRHELARFKRMDRVVLPRDTERVGNLLIKGYCLCGCDANTLEHIYCPWCGRRFLWEKVEKCV